MRSLKVIVWCDACPLDKQVAAVRAFTLGLNERDDVESDGNERPALYTLDLCGKHADALMDPLAKLLTEAVPFHPATPTLTRPAHRSRPVDAPAPSDGECPECHAVMRRSSLITHIWNVHRPGDKRSQPARCPDCGRDYGGRSPQAMGVHRRLAHDWDPVGEAIAGIRR